MLMSMEDILSLLKLHILSIYFLTSLISLFFAWILYNSSTAGTGRWIRLLGWFFLAICLMYVVKITEELFANYKAYLNILNQLLSTINNLLMFLAANELLSGQIKLRLEERNKLLISLYYQIRNSIAFKYRLLAIIATGISIIQPFLNTLIQPKNENLVEFIVRLFDGVFSAICFIYLGYAFWVNITFLHKRGLAIIGFIPIFIYALINVPYIFNPIVFSDNTMKLVDFIIFSVSLFLKAAIFAIAYYLGVKIIEVTNEIRKTIDLVVNTRKNFLSPTGILESIGKVLKASSVTLFIRMPSKNDKRVTHMKWVEDWDTEKYSKNLLPELSEFPEVEKIFNKGGSENIKIGWGFLQRFFFSESETKESVDAYAPIIFNGAVIGCLELELNKFASETSVINYQIDRFVKGIATAVQAYREGLSLKQATYKCATYQFEEHVVNGSKAIIKITEAMNDILCPEGIRITGDIGFRRKNHTIPVSESDTKNRILRKLQNTYIDNSEDLDKSIPPETKDTLETNILLLREAPLELTIDGSRPFGKLFLLIKSDKDNINSPTLGIYPMHRRAIATIISDSLFDLARDYLNKNLTDLGLDLSQEPISINQWFQLIESAAKRAELLWTVATNPDSEDDFLGEEKYVNTVKDCWDDIERGSKEKLFSSPVIGKDNTIHIITVRLNNTKQTFWFGVENPNFGSELNFNSPWKIFLEHLADIADATLFKIQAQEKQVENTSHHAMATMATTTGTIVHQLVNMSKNNEVGFKAIYEAIENGKLRMIEGNENEIARKESMYKRLALGLRDSGSEMLDLTKAFREITQFSEEKPSNLLKALERAEKLFSLTLIQNNISVETCISRDIQVDISFHIVSLALANLFSNSKDALKGYKTKKKKIRITAMEETDSVSCFVIDNGPGISENIQSDIFKLGKTTKVGGSGWGLYLVKRALRENNSDIELISSFPSHTEFKLTFPKVKN